MRSGLYEFLVTLGIVVTIVVVVGVLVVVPVTLIQRHAYREAYNGWCKMTGNTNGLTQCEYVHMTELSRCRK